MGTPVQGDDANLGSVLGFNHHVSRTLHDHQATVVPTGDYGRSAMQGNARHAYTQILGSIGVYYPLPIPLFGHEVSPRGLAPCLTLWSQWRNSAIRGIYDQRRSMVRPDPVLPRAESVCFEVIVGGSGVVLCVAAASRAVIGILHACLESFLRLLIRQKLSVSVFGGAFHGRKAQARPISLQVRLAVRRTWHGPSLLTCRRLCVRLGGRLRGRTQPCLGRNECRGPQDRRHHDRQSAR